MSEEQIAMVRARIAEVTHEHQRNGWTITFANGKRASAQLIELSSDDGTFDALATRYRYQHTNSGAHDLQQELLRSAVDRIDGTPYESYYESSVLVARGKQYEVHAQAISLGTLRDKETLAALAAVALRAIEV